MKQRHLELVRLVSENRRMEVHDLAKRLDTSLVTIRKDLDYLEEKQVLRRERGVALLLNEQDINYRMAFHYETKWKIAVKAAELVQSGESIIVESGSTCALFVEALMEAGKTVTVITNSSFIANLTKGNNEISIILLGGNYQKQVQTSVGPITKAGVRQFHVDKIFVGTDGFSLEFGFTGDDIVRSDTVQAMTKCAEHTYVLMESIKFQQPRNVRFLNPEDVHMVITDNGIPVDVEKFLSDQKVTVVTV